MPSLNEMLEERKRKEVAIEERKQVVPVGLPPAQPADASRAKATQRKREAKKPELPLDKDTWEALLNCVEVTRHKNNRYFLEHAKKVAALKSRSKKQGITFDQSMLSTVAIVRDIRRSLAFLAKHKPVDAEGTIELPTAEADDA
jgi:hypothetical protein